MSCISVLLATGLLLAEVVSRRLLGTSLRLGATEHSGYLLAAIVFFGLSYTLRVDGLIRVDFFFERLGLHSRRRVLVIGLVTGSIYSFVVAYYVITYVYGTFSLALVSSGLTRVPLYLPQLSMALGSIAFAFCMAATAFEQIKKGSTRYENAFEAKQQQD